jgi:hypothetical protein
MIKMHIGERFKAQCPDFAVALLECRVMNLPRTTAMEARFP